MRVLTLVLAIAFLGCGASNVRRDGGNSDGGGLNFDFAGGAVCGPADPASCDGSSVKVCRADGSGYDYTLCATGCMNGVCSCTPGALQCIGQDVMKCDANGAFVLDHTCTVGMKCQDGACGDPRCADEVMSTNPHALPTNAWPRFRHDNRNTGSTPTMVADNPKFKWKVPIGGTSMSAGALAGGPVVDQMNRIYMVGGEMDGKGSRRAASASRRSRGPAIWRSATTEPSTSPATTATSTPFNRRLIAAGVSAAGRPAWCAAHSAR